jgi:Family of unknown function (DUF6152)
VSAAKYEVKMNSKVVVLCGAALLLSAVTAVAHHSTAHYDFGQPAQVTGTVKLINAVNPHLRLILLVTDQKGMHEIEFEGHSLNHYYRAGWRKGVVVPGDKITINYSPVKGGEEGGYVTAIQTAKGEWIRVGVPIQ